MQKEKMCSKIHKAIVTQAVLNYTGSITVDKNWLDACGLEANDKVLVVNNNNGQRFNTYIIVGEAGSKTICVNGAAARLVAVGDILIIIGFGIFNDEEAKNHEPKVIFPQEDGGYKTLMQIIENDLLRIALGGSELYDDIDGYLKEISMKYGRSLEEITHIYKNL